MADVFKIENNTSAFIYLFATPSFPSGLRLIPGLNTVPKLFMDEFQEHSAMTEATPVRASVLRYPGREVLEGLQAVVSYHTAEGPRTGPRITIYTDDQVGREDGPIPPQDLKGIKEEAAIATIRVTSDKAALKRWSKDNRSAVASAAMAKLNGE
jgi:hypothetical protein